MSHAETVEERLGYPHTCVAECSTVDDKGRPPAEHMSERALLIELVNTTRALQTQVEGFMGDMSGNPMFRAMGSMFGGNKK